MAPVGDGRARAIQVAAAGVLAIALVAALVVTSLRLARADGRQSARSSVLAAARVYAVDVASYDYRTATQDFGVVLDHADASFKRQFINASRSLEPLIQEYRGTATAQVLQAGIAQSTPNRATVVLFVNRTVSSDRSPGRQTQRNRMVMTLVRSKGQWLIHQVTLV